MTHKNNNWINYLLVFALMLLPLQNGMAAVNSFASAPAEVKKMCHEMAEHSQHHANTAEKMDMQQHTNACCDKNTNCQQQCADCLHCPAGSAAINNSSLNHAQGIEHLFSSLMIFPETVFPSSQLKPPRA
jgi:hypothetical protein